MKERPIIFSAWKIRRILEWDFDVMGDMQTRRVIKPQPVFLPDGDVEYKGNVYSLLPRRFCPYGREGDRLWVKEDYSWVTLSDIFDPWDSLFSKIVTIPRDYKHPHAGCRAGLLYRATDVDWETEAPWRSCRYMPRWASRITLEVTAVRVERLQDISERDAADEGCPGNIRKHSSARNEFALRWNKINSKRGYSWESNSWVWVVEFRVLEATK